MASASDVDFRQWREENIKFNASANDVDFRPWREENVIKILNECKRKNFSVAGHLFDDYQKYCKPYWEKYDALFNYKFNKCGFCTRMKRALVKSRWSCAEEYPLHKHLVCVNENCEFYLIINSDIEREI